jgi:hypothetical protein
MAGCRNKVDSRQLIFNYFGLERHKTINVPAPLPAHIKRFFLVQWVSA